MNVTPLPLWNGDVPSRGASVYHPEKRGLQMGQQATLCSPFTNFNMVSVCVGMALGIVATPLLVHHCFPRLSPASLWPCTQSQTDPIYTHTHTYIDSIWNYTQITSSLLICFCFHTAHSQIIFSSYKIIQMYSFRYSVSSHFPFVVSL